MDVQRTTSLSDRLRDRGLRATAPRVKVLAALEDLGGHRTADEVWDHVDTTGPSLPRSSVYNILGSLVDAGLALTADTGSRAARYEIATRPHHHFVCRTCHEVIDVPCASGSAPCLDTDRDVGAIEHAQVIYRGVCAACLATDAER